MRSLMLLAVLPLLAAALLAGLATLLLLLLLLLGLASRLVLVGHDVFSFSWLVPVCRVTDRRTCRRGASFRLSSRPHLRSPPRGTGRPAQRFNAMTIKHIVAEAPAEHQGRAPGLYDEQLQRQQQERLLFQSMFETRVEEVHVLPAPHDTVFNRLRRALHI